MKSFADYVKESINYSTQRPGYIKISLDLSGASDEQRIILPPIKKVKARTSKEKTLGNPVYYAYTYQTAEKITDLLKSIKGSGSHKVDKIELDRMIDKTALSMTKSMPKFDCIVCPKSSSDAVRLFAMKVGKYSATEVIYDTFDKSKIVLPKDRKEAIQYVINNFIDMKRFNLDYTQPDPDERAKVLNSLASGIVRSLNSSGKVELKKLYKPVAKFASNFMRREVHLEYQLFDKKVLVVDDSFSSGGTMMDMFRIVMDECGASEVAGCVMFMQSSK